METYATDHAAQIEATSRLATVIHAETHEQEIKQYSQWVNTYDQDMVTLGFNGYNACSRKVAEVAPNKTVKILDLGCGTGHFGETLKLMGYENICGIDANESFVEKSRARKIYRQVEIVDIGSNSGIPFDDESFDIIIGISVIGPRAMDQHTLPEVNRILRKGGYFIAFMRKSRLEMQTEDFDVKSVFEKYEVDGIWERQADHGVPFYQNAVDGDVVEIDGVVVTVRKR
ncbi:methyltransferase-like protein 27 [Diadema antillarum]|uniref:methyltransferase-like protein 27 n=1 Tax=Diadema antillarum TaxID=105358 RepID=UPI003A87CD45